MSKKKKHFKKVILEKEGYYGDYIYAYPKTGHTIREELNDKRGCKKGEYRIKEIKKGVKILLCITKKKGKRGGQTKALAIIRDISRIKQYKKHYQKKEPQLIKAVKKVEKIKKKKNKC